MTTFARAGTISILATAALLMAGQPPAGQQSAKAPAADKTAAKGAKTATAANLAGATYVGSEACGLCHEDIGKALPKSPHGAVEAGNVPSFMKHDFTGKACESCHGPGSKHVESLSAADIRNPAKMPAPEVDRTCLACHRNQPTTSGRLEASHAHNDIACTACHSIHAHGPQGLVARKPAEVNSQCESCHIDVKASFAEPFRHKVPENAMTCIDCHNPHGSFKPGLQRVSHANEPGCLNCHTDKRGPFAFEHSPVRDEGCQSCHTPHGSQNAKMLVRQDVRLVCLECHANVPSSNSTATVRGVVPPSFHDMTSPMYRNCTVCHQKIHGSHIDRNLLR